MGLVAHKVGSVSEWKSLNAFWPFLLFSLSSSLALLATLVNEVQQNSCNKFSACFLAKKQQIMRRLLAARRFCFALRFHFGGGVWFARCCFEVDLTEAILFSDAIWKG